MNKKLLTLPLVMAPLLASCGSNSSIIIVKKMININITKTSGLTVPFCVTKKAFSVKAGEQKTFKIRYTQAFITPFSEAGCLSQFFYFASEPLDPSRIYSFAELWMNSVDAIGEINDYNCNNLTINKSPLTDAQDWFDNVENGEESNTYIMYDDGTCHIVECAFKGKEGDSINETVTITFKKDFENIYMNVCLYIFN